MNFLLSILAALMLSILSNWFYDIAVEKRLLPASPKAKWVLFALCACIPLSLIAALPNEKEPNNAESLNSTFSTYLSSPDSGCNFQIDHPEDWQIQNLNNPITKEIIALVPKESRDRKAGQAKMIIQCIPLTNILSLSEYVNELIIQDAKKKFSNLQKLEEIDFTFSKRLARKITYQVPTKEGKYSYVEIVMLHDNYAYQATFRVPVSQYSKYEKDVEKMIESFSIYIDE